MWQRKSALFDNGRRSVEVPDNVFPFMIDVSEWHCVSRELTEFSLFWWVVLRKPNLCRWRERNSFHKKTKTKPVHAKSENTYEHSIAVTPVLWKIASSTTEAIMYLRALQDIMNNSTDTTNPLVETEESSVDYSYEFSFVSTLVAVLFLLLLIREFYVRRYGVDFCPVFHLFPSINNNSSSRQSQVDQDRAYAQEVQRQLDLENHEAELEQKRKERREWYESFIVPYTMVSRVFFWVCGDGPRIIGTNVFSLFSFHPLKNDDSITIMYAFLTHQLLK